MTGAIMRGCTTGILLLSFTWLGCAELPTAEPPHPAVMTAVTSPSVRGTVNANVDAVPTVRITDQYGQPMAGVEVQYEPRYRAGSFAVVIAHSDANGIASMGEWKLGTLSGTEVVAATSSGLPAVVFTAVAMPDVPASITATGGNAQKGERGKELFSPLSARVIDRFGNGIAGVAVEFVVNSGGGSITPSDELTTDAHGNAEARWTLGELGENSVVAIVRGLDPLTYSATAVDFGTEVYELDHIVTNPALHPAARSKIGLLPNGRFVTYIESVWGEGTYSIHDGVIDLFYSDDFFGGLADLGYWPTGVYSRPRTEQGEIKDNVVEIRRCLYDDCYESVWVYLQLSP